MTLSVFYFLKTHFKKILDCFLTVLSPWPPCKNTLPLVPCASALLCMDLIFCGFHTEGSSAWESRWGKDQDLVSSFCLKSQPYRAPGNLLLFSTSCFFCFLFFPCRRLTGSRQTPLTKHRTRPVCAFPRVCAGTRSSWCGSGISERYQHIFIWSQFGGGAPSLLWARLFATDPISSTWDAELLAAESHTSNEKSLFLNRTVKKKEGCLCLSYKTAMI